CGMGEPGAGASCFCLSQREPGAEGDNDADEDMLAEDSPGEGDDHPGELVDGPEADELRIVEPTGNDVPVRHGDAPSRPIASDDRGHDRGDDRDAGADADADADWNGDLAEREAPGGEADQAA